MKIFQPTLLALLFCVLGCSLPRHTKRNPSSNANGGKTYKTLEEKYSYLLGTAKENITNKKLYSFIEDWYGAPYQYGGKTKKGIDCSGFTSILFKQVFGKELSGSSSAIYNQCKRISKKELQEGDLVFFKIDSKEVSHVGIYLQNHKFVHATTKAGVRIDNVNDEYYRKYFWAVGRLN